MNWVVIAAAGPVAGCAVSSATARPRGGLGTGGGGGGGSTQHVPNPTFDGVGAPPWDNDGNAILLGNGQAVWAEDGYILSPLTEVPDAADFALQLVVTNLAGNTITVRLYNVGANTNQIIYQGVATGTIDASGAATAIRDRIRVEAADGGSASIIVTSVTLTT